MNNIKCGKQKCRKIWTKLRKKAAQAKRKGA
jgi:hypothetical protein